MRIEFYEQESSLASVSSSDKVFHWDIQEDGISLIGFDSSEYKHTAGYFVNYRTSKSTLPSLPMTRAACTKWLRDSKLLPKTLLSFLFPTLTAQSFKNAISKAPDKFPLYLSFADRAIASNVYEPLTAYIDQKRAERRLLRASLPQKLNPIFTFEDDSGIHEFTLSLSTNLSGNPSPTYH